MISPLLAALPAILSPRADDNPLSLDALLHELSSQDQEDPRRPRPFDPEPVEPALQEGFESLRAEVARLSVAGWTRVREWDSQPAKLRLAEDLGLESAGGIRLSYVADGIAARLTLAVEFTQMSGRGTFPEDFSYDEGNFRGNAPFSTRGAVLFARGLLTWKHAIWSDRRSWLGPVVGLELPRIHLGIRQPGVDQSTEDYTQFLPYPVVGLASELQMDDRIALSFHVFGTRVPRLGTPFQEGGQLIMSASTLAGAAKLEVRLADGLAFTVGIEGRTWFGSLHSREDGNELELRWLGILLGIDLRW